MPPRGKNKKGGSTKTIAVHETVEDDAGSAEPETLTITKQSVLQDAAGQPVGAKEESLSISVSGGASGQVAPAAGHDIVPANGEPAAQSASIVATATSHAAAVTHTENSVQHAAHHESHQIAHHETKSVDASHVGSSVSHAASSVSSSHVVSSSSTTVTSHVVRSSHTSSSSLLHQGSSSALTGSTSFSSAARSIESAATRSIEAAPAVPQTPITSTPLRARPSEPATPISRVLETSIQLTPQRIDPTDPAMAEIQQRAGQSSATCEKITRESQNAIHSITSLLAKHTPTKAATPVRSVHQLSCPLCIGLAGKTSTLSLQAGGPCKVCKEKDAIIAARDDRIAELSDEIAMKQDQNELLSKEIEALKSRLHHLEQQQGLPAGMSGEA